MRRFRIIIEADNILKKKNIFLAVSNYTPKKEMSKRYSGNQNYYLFEISR